MTRRPGAGQTSLASSVAWFTGSYGFAILGYLVVNATAARLLGPDDFGTFVVVYTVSVVAVQVGLLGVHRAGLREAARVKDDNDASLAWLRQGVSAVTWLTIPLCGLVSAVAAWFLASGSATDRAVISVGTGVLVVLAGHQKLWANYLRGFGAVRFASLMEGRSGGALVSMLQGGLMLAVAQLAPSWGMAGALAAVALGYLIPVLIAWRVVARRWSHLPAPGRRLAYVRVVASRDWRFLMIQLSQSLNQNLELWFAGLLLASHDASLFAAAQRLALLVAFPLTSIQVVFSPTISRLWAEGDLHRLENVVRTGASFATLAALLVWLPMTVAPAEVLELVFGEPFRDAALVLALLGTAYLINVLSGLCGAALSMSHHEGRAALVTSCAVVLRAGLGVVLALSLGIDGLAVGAVVVALVLNAFLFRSARTLLGVSTLPTLRPSLRLLRTSPG